MASPNQFGNRETARDVTLNGTHIPKGSNLHLCIGAANRDPEVFDNPTKFEVARRSNRHLAFAGGPHVCVGLTLARMEGRIALSRFLNRYPDYKISENRVSGGRIRFRGYAHLPAKL
jgi:cytochrome P450